MITMKNQGPNLKGRVAWSPAPVGSLSGAIAIDLARAVTNPNGGLAI
ncbi:hypothetical protein PQR57_46580 [Paraburkholderia dipogonis]|jgi:hypothetical protein|uniref:Uncharacterized protein n=1 Tax=Paraburkholderia dipogonis TaxID=1211383 RepID=A0ABW9B601_9BURK